MTLALLQDLARRIERSDPSDTREQNEILDRLRELHGALHKAGGGELLQHVEAAGLLTSYLARMGSIAGKEVLDIVARLLRTAACLEPRIDPASGAGKAAQQARGRSGAPAPKPRAGKGRPAAKPDAASSGKGVSDLVNDMFLGQILLRRSYVDEEGIQRALALQRKQGVRFGEALIQIGAATREQVVEGLNYQDACQQLRETSVERSTALSSMPIKEMAKADHGGLRLVSDVLLGEVLVELGIVSKKQLERALETQRATGVRIGEALVRSGACSWQKIERGLKVQAQRRKHA